MTNPPDPAGLGALLGVRRAGRVTERVLRAVRSAAAPGVTVGELDSLARRLLDASDARGAMLGYRDALAESPFPGALSISINDAISGGFEPDRALAPGDLVTADLACEHRAWHADAAVTWAMPGADPRRAALAEASRLVTQAGVRACRHGVPWSAVVGAMDAEASRLGAALIRGFFAHGVGRAMHLPPALPLHPDGLDARGPALAAGQTITIEPVVAWSDPGFARNAWLDRTADGSDACFTEATVGVGRGRSAVLAGVLDRVAGMT